MKTEVLTIRRELPAMRCEICHQTDCFTPETGVCTRCAGISTDSLMVEPIRTSRMFSNYGGSPPTWDRAALQAAFDGIALLNRTTIFYLLAILPFIGGVFGTLLISNVTGWGHLIYLLSFLESFVSLVWGSVELIRNGARETEDWPALALAGFGGTFCIVAMLVYLFSRAFW